jgi:hypothetical protein
MFLCCRSGFDVFELDFLFLFILILLLLFSWMDFPCICAHKRKP